MIKISIIPIVKKYYNGHIFGVDRKLIIFLTKLFKRNEIEILTRAYEKEITPRKLQ
jgi:hypothetical protein